ncbi:MAG: tetratricopeptide repeat protein [Ignavibacteriales bacterium]|nr:MAG: tetratricopeptide repeat protein [Ignavibacteriales bacterium]
MEDFMFYDPEDFFDQVIEALGRGDFNVAEKLLEEYLKSHSEDTQSRLLKSLIQEAKGDLLGAITPLEEILIIDNSNDLALYSLTNYYYMSLDFNKSIECCDEFIAIEGAEDSEEAIDLRQIKVQSLYAQGKYADALEEIEDLLKLDRKDEKMIIYKAKIFNINGSYDAAKNILNPIISAIADEGLLGHAYYVLAMSYHHLGQTDKSDEFLYQSAELNDEFGMRWLKLKLAAEWNKQMNQNNN